MVYIKKGLPTLYVRKDTLCMVNRVKKAVLYGLH